MSLNTANSRLSFSVFFVRSFSHCQSRRAQVYFKSLFGFSPTVVASCKLSIFQLMSTVYLSISSLSFSLSLSLSLSHTHFLSLYIYLSLLLSVSFSLSLTHTLSLSIYLSISPSLCLFLSLKGHDCLHRRPGSTGPGPIQPAHWRTLLFTEKSENSNREREVKSGLNDKSTKAIRRKII